MYDISDFAAHGLYDEDRPDPERLELLSFLVSEGITLDQIATAERNGRLASLLTDQVAGQPDLTLIDVAATAGQTPELIARVWRAAGFPDPDPEVVLFTESDAEALTAFSLGVDLFGEGPALQLVRVVGSSLSRIAEAQLTTAMANVTDAYMTAATSPLDAMRTSAALLSILPTAERAIVQLLRRHLVAANRRLELLQPYDSGSEVRNVTVGFADLSESTKLSDRLSWAEFADTMTEFEALASDIVTAGSGHVVKSIGDEVMFVAPGNVEACRIALGLIDAFVEHPVLPRLRIGLAAGPVVARDGDYFGEVVHLASRLVDLAEPGTIVVTEDIAEVASSSGLVAVLLGDHTLKGFRNRFSLHTLSAPDDRRLSDE